MKKNYFNYKKNIILILFILINMTIFANNKNYESEFLAIGNIKIVRPEPLEIVREDLTIIIEKDKSVNVESFYTFKNIGEHNIKSTFMFWLDQNIKNNSENKLTNVKGKYIKNIKFFSDYTKSENLRAVINFNEKIYDNQEENNIQREWFAISKIIPKNEIGKLGVYYKLVNTNFEKNKKMIYSFDLVDNFNEKNKTQILYVNIINRSNEKIEKIEYNGYTFNKINKKNNEKEQYELLEGNVKLNGKMVINFK